MRAPALLALLAAPAQADCRPALRMGFDVSASVDAREYRLMIEGTAATLRSPAVAGVTINALAVGGDLPLDHGTMAEGGWQLSAWIAAHVLTGPGAFVLSAQDYKDFARAMAVKLEREPRPPLLGLLGGCGRDPALVPAPARLHPAGVGAKSA